MLSKRASGLKTSPTLALVAKAKELQAKGHDVISLTVGEPDWPTIPMASEAGITAIRSGFTKYTPANGTMELRQALAEKYKRELGVDYKPNEIVVGPGAKFVIFAALQMICDAGDEVILQSPYWVSYPTMIELADGVPRIVETGAADQYKLSARALEAAITPKTKAFLFCSPSNPTGMMYSEQELREIADVLRKHPRIVVLSDDIYNRLVFTGGRAVAGGTNKVAPQLLHVAPDLRDRVIAINGASKAYSMTGWRLGWAAGPAAIIKAMGDYQSQSTGAPSSIAQAAALPAVRDAEKDIAGAVELLTERREGGLKVLRTVPGFEVSEPDGAFYFWVDIRKALGRRHGDREIKTDTDFCDVLLNEYFVATVPGAECGAPGFMRLSFACRNEDLVRAADRMKQMIAKFV